MSEETEYYENLLTQGYSAEKAQSLTQKYFPEFTTELPEPAPPASFIEQSNDLPVMDSEEPGVDIEEMVEDGKILLEMARDKIVENQKIAMIAGSIFLILMLSIIAYKIPSKIGPMEGEWMKSDGETVSFIAGCDQSLTVGCTDPESSNYDENAIVDDGSCEQIGIEELIQHISIYPNPASDNILINYGK